MDLDFAMNVVKNRNKGTAAIEYALILTLISSIAIVATRKLGTDLSGLFTALDSNVEKSGTTT